MPLFARALKNWDYLENCSSGNLTRSGWKTGMIPPSENGATPRIATLELISQLFLAGNRFGIA